MPNTNNAYDLLKSAHIRKAKRNAITFGNFGWVAGNDGICSKTSKGYLTTRRMGPNQYGHKLQAYDDNETPDKVTFLCLI